MTVMLRTIARSVVVLGFLIWVTSGVLFTLTHTWLPLRFPLPSRLLHFSYATMAPFQGYVTTNAELIAEGRQEEGAWEPIDLARYVPLSPGIRNVWMHLRSFKRMENDDRQQEHMRARYRTLALLLRDREQQSGRDYRSVRLSWQEWPASPAGYRFLQHNPFAETKLITTVP